MKNPGLKKLFIVAMSIMMSSALFAQRGSGYAQGKCYRIPELTEEQQEKINQLRTGHWNNMQEYRNQIRENRARYITLTSSPNPDENTINKNIDEWTSLKGEMMKERTGHLLEVKSLLTDEQKVWFDKFTTTQGRGQGPYMRQRGNRGRGYGQG
ncbi:MAG: Spy/CpxP family protein refolding chaperone, partial [Bacteroidota bacterium]